MLLIIRVTQSQLKPEFCFRECVVLASREGLCAIDSHKSK